MWGKARREGLLSGRVTVRLQHCGTEQDGECRTRSIRQREPQYREAAGLRLVLCRQRRQRAYASFMGAFLCVRKLGGALWAATVRFLTKEKPNIPSNGTLGFGSGDWIRTSDTPGMNRML